MSLNSSYTQRQVDSRPVKGRQGDIHEGYLPNRLLPRARVSRLWTYDSRGRTRIQGSKGDMLLEQLRGLSCAVARRVKEAFRRKLQLFGVPLYSRLGQIRLR